MSNAGLQFDQDLGGLVVTAIMARKGKKVGKEIAFCCPCHDDHKPSASYNVNKQTWYCQVCEAGGGLVDLAGKLGIEKRRTVKPRTQASIVAIYDYTDAERKPLYQVVRYEPKTFRQRHPDGNGGWVWSMEGVTVVPYRLPDLTGADPAATVFVVEGEKDADNLAALGLVATTNHGGAGKWREAHSFHLKGRTVALVPDNDDAGRKHMEAVGRSLKAIGVATLKWIALPGLGARQDVSDWLAMGNGAEDLRALVEAAGEWQAPTDPLDMLADSPAKPVMERMGLGYAFRYPKEKVNVVIDHIHRSSDGLGAEILVTGDLPMCPRHLHWAKVNLASTSNRKTITTLLQKRTEGALVDWTTIIEDVCYQVAMEERKGEPFVQLGDLPIDAQKRWAIENFAPKRQATTLFGPGSSGKSRLAMALAVSVESGVEVVPGCLPRMQGKVLYLDWETEGEEVQQRVREICRGAEIEECYPLYRRCTGALTDQIEDVLRMVQQHDIQLVVVDSVEAAIGASREYAGDPNDAIIRLHQSLRLLSTTSILIDHISAGTLADSKAIRKAYGSIFKMNYARMAFELKSVVNGPGKITLGLYNVKRNNGGLALKPRAIQVEFAEDQYTRYLQGIMSDPDLMQGMDATDQIIAILKEGPMHKKDIAALTGLTEGTVGVKLSQGKTQKRLFVDLGGGRWGLAERRREAGDAEPF